MKVYIRVLPVTFLLALVIILAQCTSYAEPNDFTLFDQKSGQWDIDYAQSVASVNDTLYIARSEGLYSYQLGDEAPHMLIDFAKTDVCGNIKEEAKNGIPTQLILLTDAGVLYALDELNGSLWRFDGSTSVFSLVSSFDAKNTFDTNQQNYSFGYCMAEGNIYFISKSATNANSNLMMLDVINEKTLNLCSNILMVTSYKPGILLVGEGRYGRLTSLSLLNIQTGLLEGKVALTKDYRGLCYDSETDTTYIWRDGQIDASISFSQPKAVSYTPIMSPLSKGALLSGDMFALPYEDGVRIYSMAASELESQPLKIHGWTQELPLTAFNSANPEAIFELMDTFPKTTSDLLLHMMGGDSSADIYVVNSRSYDLDAIIKKGYYVDLACNETIRKSINDMYPFLRDELTYKEKIAAFPCYNNFAVNSYCPKAFEEIGLAEVDIPRTYADLLDFIDLWAKDYAEKYPSMSLFGQYSEPNFIKKLITIGILDDYRYDCLRRGTPAIYNTPDIQMLLEKLTRTDFSCTGSLIKTYSDIPENMTNEDLSKQLFTFGGASSLAAYGEVYSYMPLAISSSIKPVVLAYTQLLLINPYTHNMDKAIAFVEFVAANLPITLSTDLMPNHNDPIRDPNFDLSWLDANIEITKSALAKANDVDRKELQEELENWYRVYEFERNYEWLATSDSIAAFRNLDRYFTLQTSIPLYGMGADEEIMDLIYNRFLDGQISVSQFVQELDRKLSMIELEDQ